MRDVVEGAGRKTGVVKVIVPSDWYVFFGGVVPHNPDSNLPPVSHTSHRPAEAHFLDLLPSRP